jgi:ABC-type dipeptide/oligopeptide/nickel transport system permease component
MFEIIMLGYVVNILTSLVFIITFAFVMTINIFNDPIRMLELQQIENNLKEFSRLKANAKFTTKYYDFIVFLLPFSSLLKYAILVRAIYNAKGFGAYIEQEIRRLKIENGELS